METLPSELTSPRMKGAGAATTGAVEATSSARIMAQTSDRHNRREEWGEGPISPPVQGASAPRNQVRRTSAQSLHVPPGARRGDQEQATISAPRLPPSTAGINVSFGGRGSDWQEKREGQDGAGSLLDLHGPPGSVVPLRQPGSALAPPHRSFTTGQFGAFLVPQSESSTGNS